MKSEIFLIIETDTDTRAPSMESAQYDKFQARNNPSHNHVQTATEC